MLTFDFSHRLEIYLQRFLSENTYCFVDQSFSSYLLLIDFVKEIMLPLKTFFPFILLHFKKWNKSCTKIIIIWKVLGLTAPEKWAKIELVCTKMDSVYIKAIPKRSQHYQTRSAFFSISQRHREHDGF